jgi:hypothetical protein
MAFGRAQSGRAIEQSADELVRIWRLARAASRREVFPGLLDGLMGSLFARAGRLLAEGGAPEEVWPGLEGVVRWPMPQGAPELTSEWALASQVLTAACKSFGAEPETARWLARALAEAERGTSVLRDPRPSPPRPEGVVVLLVPGESRLPRRV